MNLNILIENTSAKLILLSYNNEGFIKPDDIKNIFEKFGKYSFEKKLVRRFKCTKTNSDVDVYEYVHILEKIDKLNFKTKFGNIYNCCCN